MRDIFEAARKGDVGQIKKFVSAGINVNSEKRAKTALHIAVEFGHLHAVKVLLELGADINFPTANMHKKSSLHIAAERGAADIVKCLLTHGAKVDQQKSLQETALHLAIKKQYFNVVTVLLEHNAKIEIQNEYKDTALHLAVKLKDETILVAILNCENRNIDQKNKLGETALHIAAKEGFAQGVKLLLDAGADLSIKDGGGSTPVHLATEAAHNEVIAVFSAHSTLALEQKDDLGQSSIFTAIEQGDYELVRGLIKQGANINEQNRFGETIVHVMVDDNNLIAIKALADLGADFSIENRYGETAWHIASRKNYIELAEYLWDEKYEKQLVKNTQLLEQQAVIIEAKQIEAQAVTENSNLEKRLESLEVSNKLLMQEYQLRQELLAAENYISNNEMLRTFNRHLQSKLTELFLAYKVIASGIVVRNRKRKEDGAAATLELAGSAVDIVTGVVVDLAFGEPFGAFTPPVGRLLGKLIGKGIGRAITGNEENAIDKVSNQVPTLSQLDQSVAACGILVSFQYERQIVQLKNAKAVKKLAECAVARLISYMRNSKFNPDLPLAVELCHGLPVHKSKQGLLPFTSKRIANNTPYKWTDNGIFRHAGVETPDMQLYVGDQVKAARYDYRLGRQEDINRLNLTEKNRNVIKHPLYKNTHRHFSDYDLSFWANKRPIEASSKSTTPGISNNG